MYFYMPKQNRYVECENFMHTGKLAGIIQEMIHEDIDLMGISETFWPYTGDFITSILTDPQKSFRVIYSGVNKSRCGMGFIV